MNDAPNQAPRCQQINDRGRRCGSPAMRGKELCFQHNRNSNLTSNPRNATAFIPVLESGESMQIAITNILRALAADAIEVKKAYAMFYGLQLMNSAFRHCDSNPIDDQDAQLTPAMDRKLQLEAETEEKLKLVVAPEPAPALVPTQESKLSAVTHNYRHPSKREVDLACFDVAPEDELGDPDQIRNVMLLLLNRKLRRIPQPTPDQVRDALDQIASQSELDADRVAAYLEMFSMNQASADES